MPFDPVYFVFLAPAMLLMMWAQWRVKSAYASAMQIPSHLSGAAAARYILDQGGLHDVAIEETHGHLSDHYDPRDKVLRLSSEVYHTPSMAAVGIAAHEAGHALQDAHGYLPLVIRNAAVPAATFGSATAMILIIVGFVLAMAHVIFGKVLLLLGFAGFGMLLIFQLVNLPVEFDASNRAKAILAELNIVDQNGAVAVRDVLNAAGWTYVAATLQTFLTLLYYVFRFGSALNSNDDR